MFPSTDTSACSPLPSSGYHGRSLRKPCGSPPSLVLRGRKTARPSFSARLRSPLAIGTSHGEEEMGELSWVPGNPFGSMPRARDSGDPGATSHYRSFRVLPSALLTASASRPAEFSELNLRGLLPCCVRFAPTSRPVNGNTHYRPARSLWPGGTYTRWIPIRSFTVSSSVPPLPSFPSAMTMSAVSSTIRAHDGMHSETERHFALDEIAQANHGSLLIVRVRNSVRPSHLFDH